MKIGLYPGTFDPLTNGHLDIIVRSSKLCEKLIVAVAKNTSKNPLFSIDKRIKLINEAINANNVDNNLIYAEAFDNLLIDFAKTNEVSIIIRGLRVVSDFDYEFQMAQMNFNLADFETIFIPASPEYGYVSSSMVKEIFSYGGDVNALVPSIVVERLKDV